MRDQYAGDVSDYLKYAFLRAMVEPGTSLGMAWYYLSGHDGRADGRHEEYLSELSWAALDPDLFQTLQKREGRSVAEHEGMKFWPADTSFHREPVPAARERGSWAEGWLSPFGQRTPYSPILITEFLAKALSRARAPRSARSGTSQPAGARFT